ncbi:60S ribosomal protein L21-2 [Thalictrum thalictroides]|uniref:60S ribosomal protein L21-2 n=1 Tax=Thalictrum thalictroides TaxID=46969 RepID=A0A7J6VEI5_THATH|nr:60S ribosomal protein L21-2 [Thalictrum thalictroides]
MPAGHGLLSNSRSVCKGLSEEGLHSIVNLLENIQSLECYQTSSWCEINKQVGNRIIRKRIHVRVEHVQASRCKEEFKLRKVQNDKLKAEAKAQGEKISTKRQPEGPKPGFMEGATLETVTPIPYDVVNDLKGGY